jgi:phage regulator Rha-like protein
MNELTITVNKRDLLIDSRQFAEPLDVRHRAIIALIRTHEESFKRFGSLLFKKADVETTGGTKQVTYCELNENQAYMLLTLVRNSPKAVALKGNLVAAFVNTRTALAQRDTARIEGKAVRKLETDSIAALVKYAKAQGSANADMYYVTVTKLTNKLLGIETGTRDQLDATTLKKINIAETVADIAVRDGLAARLDYKDIYKVAKNRIEDLGPIVLTPRLLT